MDEYIYNRCASHTIEELMKRYYEPSIYRIECPGGIVHNDHHIKLLKNIEIFRPGLAKLTVLSDRVTFSGMEEDIFVLGNLIFRNNNEMLDYLSNDWMFFSGEPFPYLNWPDAWLTTLNEIYNSINEHTLVYTMVKYGQPCVAMKLLKLGADPGEAIDMLNRIKDENLRANLHMKLQLLEKS